MGERYKYPVPHKNDVISCLAVGSRWVTGQMSLQVGELVCEITFVYSLCCHICDLNRDYLLTKHNKYSALISS